MTIEKAESSDHRILSHITKQSKAHWGYSPKQIQLWEEDLTVSEAYIQQNHVYTLKLDTQIMGYYSYFASNTPIVKLDNLFILPDYIGKGFGKILMRDFEERVTTEGFSKITLDADPHAEGFYTQLGYTVVGQLATSIPNRYLPIMEKSIHSPTS